MTNLDVTIAIPVGPYPHHKRWLREAYESAVAATPAAILIVDDMAGVTLADLGVVGEDEVWDEIRTQPPGGKYSSVWWRNPPVNKFGMPWLSGVAAAFNAGVAMAPTDWVLMLGADDTVTPDVLETWRAAVATTDNPELTYWGLPLLYLDTGEVQTVPCNAAIVHKDLWRLTGGFPPESGSGAPDCALLSIMMGNHPAAGDIRMVNWPHPVYNYRRHAETDTAGRGPWQGPILATRDLLTQLWKPVQPWGR